MKPEGFLKILSLGILFLILWLAAFSMSPKEINWIRPPSGASLEFSPDSITGMVGDIFEVGIIIDTEDKKITAADLIINFDPMKIKIIHVNPGEFLENPTILKKEIDNTQGELNLTIGGLLAKKGVGRLALIKVELRKTTPDINPTDLYFNPKTAIAAIGETESVLISTGELRITILPKL